MEDEVLQRIEAAGNGRGRVLLTASGNITFVMLNVTDPDIDVAGERSHPSTQHPMFADKAVREAINLLIDRESIQQVIYPRSAMATANFVQLPARFRSPNNRHEFNIDKANALLDTAS